MLAHVLFFDHGVCDGSLVISGQQRIYVACSVAKQSEGNLTGVCDNDAALNLSDSLRYGHERKQVVRDFVCRNAGESPCDKDYADQGHHLISISL